MTSWKEVKRFGHGLIVFLFPTVVPFVILFEKDGQGIIFW
jgi:hypothetical protein